MRIIESHMKYTKIIIIIEFQERIMKTMQIIEFHRRIMQIKIIPRDPRKHHENHETQTVTS